MATLPRNRSRARRSYRALLAAVAFLIALSQSAIASAQASEYRGRIGQVGCRPVKERTGETGCWILVNASVGKLPVGPVYWHLYSYPSQAAADTANASRGTVVQALHKVWLFTIEGADWRPIGGERVAKIGPLPVDPSAEYTARYMEAIFTPGMTSSIHRHSGPEAWYTLAGETCLETSEGKMIGRPGGPPVIVPGGVPMYLTATGTQMRRAVVLILYDSSKSAATPANDWMPNGLCGKS